MPVFKVDETTPCFRNIDIQHVICRTARRAAYFNGLPEMPVSNINIRDLEVNNVKEGIVVNHTKGVTLNDIHVQTTGHIFKANNSTDITINGKSYKKLPKEGLSLDTL